MMLFTALSYIFGRLFYEGAQQRRAERYAQDELRKFKARKGWL